ncbi:MAG: hypothetical protein V4450_11830 [Bacteroidota bacterium]
MMKPLFRIIPSHEIDTARWDQCVTTHQNGLIYSTTQYLGTLCDNWHGLVKDDYTAVMALPWRTKYGVRYLYTPAFIQQLGLVGEIAENDLPEALDLIPRFVRYGDIHLNFLNEFVQNNAIVTTRTNLVIDLNRTVDNIRSAYKNDLTENIRKAATHDLVYENAEMREAITQFKKQYGARIHRVTDEDFRRLEQLCVLLFASGNCFVRSVTDNTGSLLAIALFLKDQKRIYNILNTTLAAGRDKEANHFLLDSLINEFAGSPLILDMEGSDLSGVRKFYSSFGATNQPYFHYHYNALPSFLRFVKK